MARNPYKGDLAGALQTIRDLAPGRDTSRIKDAGYAARIASGLERQVAQGKAINPQAARGHSVTPEHPGRKAPGHTSYQRGLTQQQRAQRPQGGSLTLPNGGVIISGHTKGVGRTVAGTARQMGGNIKISYMGKDGRRHELFSKGGLKSKDFKDALAKHGSLGGAVAALAGAVYRDVAEAMPEDDAEFDFYIE